MRTYHSNSGISFNNSPEIDNKIDLSEILSVVIDGKWLIILISMAMLMLGIAKALFDTPIYKTDAMLQVEAHASALAPVEEKKPLENSESPVAAEIELINSRSIIWKAINNLKLDIVTNPKCFPIFGEAVKRRFEKNNKDSRLSNALFGLNNYAWGGEVIKVDQLAVPAVLLDQQLTIIAGEQGYYQLKHNDELLLEGEVGKIAGKQLENNQELSLLVSDLKARQDTEFSIMRQSESNAIEQFKLNFHAAEKGKQTKIIELTYESSNKKLAVSVLNELVNVYVQQSADHKAAEAQSSLAFLEKQLPLVKEQLDTATTALSLFRSKIGSIDIESETQSLLDGVVKTKTEVILLQQKRDELRQKFTEVHPAVIALDKQIARLEGHISEHSHKIEILPESQKEILKLSRDVNVNTELYTTLLNNAQSLRVEKESAIGDVRVIDYAVTPTLPVKPKKALIVAVFLLLGLGISLAILFIRNALHRGVKKPDLIEKILNIPIFAVIPHSSAQERLDKKLLSNKNCFGNETNILALHNKNDLAIESLRNLRTTLHFAFLATENNIIMITSPSPGIGKSFVSVNLAVVLAEAGKKVLLIDGDMRNGSLNKVLGVDRENGLTELLLSSKSLWPALLKEVLRRLSSVGVDFISTGSFSPNPSELLLHSRFGALLECICKFYDYVIVDSAPILSVADAAIIGRHASETFMVVKPGEHTSRELEESVKRLAYADVALKGAIVNDAGESFSRSGYAFTKYQQQYIDFGYKNSNNEENINSGFSTIISSNEKKLKLFGHAIVSKLSNYGRNEVDE